MTDHTRARKIGVAAHAGTTTPTGLCDQATVTTWEYGVSSLEVPT